LGGAKPTVRSGGLTFVTNWSSDFEEAAFGLETEISVQRQKPVITATATGGAGNTDHNLSRLATARAKCAMRSRHLSAQFATTRTCSRCQGEGKDL